MNSVTQIGTRMNSQIRYDRSFRLPNPAVSSLQSSLSTPESSAHSTIPPGVLETIGEILRLRPLSDVGLFVHATEGTVLSAKRYKPLTALLASFLTGNFPFLGMGRILHFPQPLQSIFGPTRDHFFPCLCHLGMNICAPLRLRQGFCGNLMGVLRLPFAARRRAVTQSGDEEKNRENAPLQG